MGAGSLVELIARGNQDIYIIGNPQFSYFKSIYRRHTNFAIEPIRQIFNESPEFGRKVTCIIDKKADLLNDILLEIELPALLPNISWTNGIGNFMIDWVELQLGGEPIDRISGELMDTWMELTTQLGTKNSVYNMVGKLPSFNCNSQTDALKLLIPLPFWFCRSIERSLPLISMQYTDVKIVIQFKNFDKCWYKNTGVDDPNYLPPANTNIVKAGLICNFVYLDVFERTKFAKQAQFEYIIEQFQEANQYKISEYTLNSNSRLFFNHPIKELIWTYRTTAAENANDYYNYANIINYIEFNEIKTAPFDKIQMTFNGNDRFEKLPETFFRLYQPYKRHSCGTNQYIYVYTFALDPENIQPSGTCNFSKLDNVYLNLECIQNIQNGTLRIYATNYNIMRIQNGMVGLAFSS
jgi:hypothetical protein